MKNPEPIRVFRLVMLFIGLFVSLAGSGWAQQAGETGQNGAGGLRRLGTAAQGGGTASNYVLSPGDIVTIKVFREPELDTQQRISKEGTINYPLIGILKVAGMSSDQAAGKIAELLDKDYLVKPQVSLSVVTYSKQKFTILGQVTSPGSYNIPDEQTLGLLNAIAVAGGFTRLAKTSKVTVTRTINGEVKAMQIDVDKMIKNGTAERFMIQPNDVIVVEERFF